MQSAKCEMQNGEASGRESVQGEAMRAVAVVEPGRVELVELEPPVPGPYQALVRTDIAALCNSTDAKLVAGRFPGVERYPLILGSETSGIVQEVGERVRSFGAGDRVIGGLLFEFSDARYASRWGGFCESTLVNDHDAMVADGVADAEHGWREVYEIQRAVAVDIPPEEAVLMCTWRDVLGAFGEFHLVRGQEILVFGAGPVGQSFVKLARLMGFGWVGAVDPAKSKRRRAVELGADEAFVPEDPALNDLPLSRDRPLDAVIDAVGSESVINAALRLIGMGGSICVYGALAQPQILIDRSAGPRNFNLLVHQWPTRWRERHAQQALTRWIRGGELKASEFVTHEFPLEKIGDALQTLRSGKVVKCILRF